MARTSSSTPPMKSWRSGSPSSWRYRKDREPDHLLLSLFLQNLLKLLHVFTSFSPSLFIIHTLSLARRAGESPPVPPSPGREATWNRHLGTHPVLYAASPLDPSPPALIEKETIARCRSTAESSLTDMRVATPFLQTGRDRIEGSSFPGIYNDCVQASVCLYCKTKYLLSTPDELYHPGLMMGAVENPRKSS